MRKLPATSLLAFAFIAATILSCGGGGGTNSILPPAPDPVCTSAVLSQTDGKTDNAKELQAPNVVVPETTIARTSDAGAVAHTNHLIYVGGGTRGRLAGPTGLVPQDLYTAYGIPPNQGSGAIAIVDAFHYPTSLNDFNVFANQFGLPIEPSTNPLLSTNAVFQVVYASGTKPVDDSGWSQEMAIDTQWAHAMAPNAKIYLVEAASNSVLDLMTAVNVAKNLPGVKQISLSFGATESACNFVKYDPNLVKAGVTFFAAAGDTSNEKDFPALSKNAVSVGGTTLNLDASGNRINENSWSQTGGGLSVFEPRPLFQDVVVNIVLGYRGGCDIAAVGDPATGVSVYDSTPHGGFSGWLIFGGTSVAAPIIAGIDNAAGSTHTSSQDFNARVYAQIGTTNFYDVIHGTSGPNSADHGWDMISGVGAPNGLNGFL